MIYSSLSPLSAFFKDRKVMVVGANGFIGRHCVSQLNEIGAKVTAFSRQPQFQGHTGFRGRYVQGDLSDRDLLESLIKEQSVVFDCAGSSSAQQSNQHAYDNLRIECQPHLNLFDVCAHADDKPLVVFLSSRLVYGKPQYLPVNELHPLEPESMYAVHKITLENYLSVFNKTSQLPYVILRLSNPYGPYIAKHNKSYGVINHFIQKAILGEDISIYGNGKQQRDYIHIDDTISAMLHVAANSKCYSKIFNLGGAETISICDAVQQIVSCVESRSAINFIDWPDEALNIETGNYATDLKSIQACFPDYKPLSFHEGVCRTIKSLLEESV